MPVSQLSYALWRPAKHRRIPALIAGLKAGEADAWEKFYDRYGAILYGIITKWILDEHTAQNMLVWCSYSGILPAGLMNTSFTGKVFFPG